MKSVVITGMGIVSSFGVGLENFRKSLLQADANFSQLHQPILSFPVLGAMIENLTLSSGLALLPSTSKEQQERLIRIGRRLPSPLQFALLATQEAWCEAALDNETGIPSRIGLIIAAQNSSHKIQYDLYPSFSQNPEYFPPSYALNFLDTSYLGITSEVFGIKGEGFTVGGASASGNSAILRGYHLIREGNHDICVVLGAMADLSPMEFQAFHNIGAMGGHQYGDKPNKACRPFDQDRDGFIYGQATACLILESEKSAKKRRVAVLGRLLGGALLLDGNSLANPSVAGEMEVMRKAICSAGLSVNDIGYINTHGTSSMLGDQVEIDAIANIFNRNLDRIVLNATKSITGHCLWSAGIVEAIATVIQLKEGFIHITRNLEHPITEKLNIVSDNMVNIGTETIALSNSFGFGGINSAIVISSPR